MKIEKVCQRCGKSFSVHPYRIAAKFCSKACSNKSNAKNGENHPNWKNAKRIYICKRCGKEFTAYALVGGGPRIFCSISCWSKFTNSGEKSYMWKGGKVSAICKHCQKTFSVDAHRKESASYCSKKCLDEARQNRIELICTQCGKAYTRQASRGNRYTENFCSTTCRFAWNVGEHSGTWKGGKSFEPYPPAFNTQFKRMICERDNYTYAVCKGRGNIVHHINYVKNDTVPENCITVCRSCHGKTNSNREYWQYTFFA